MTAEVMRPRGTTIPLTEGGIIHKPSFIEPAPDPLFSTPEIPFTEYQLPLQNEIEEKLMHLLGNKDYTPAIAVRALRERGRALENQINSVSLDSMNNGTLTMDELSEIGDRTACVRITAAIIANKFRINLGSFIDKKLMEKMQDKYNPNSVTELRLYGTPENPGRMTGPEALRSLKSKWVFDEELGRETQTYHYRRLPVPDEEEHVREPQRTFISPRQAISNLWQVKALGSDLVPSERISNLICEGGEIDEAVNIFKGMSQDEINAISPESEVDLELLRDLGFELADVWINSWCADSSNGIESAVKDKERLGIAVKKFKDGPKLRKAGVEINERLEYLDAKHKREKMGLKPPIPRVVWTLGRTGSTD